jgi:hypothetical protein
VRKETRRAVSKETGRSGGSSRGAFAPLETVAKSGLERDRSERGELEGGFCPLEIDREDLDG